MSALKFEEQQSDNQLRIGMPVIVRSNDSGCWYGILREISGSTICLNNAIRLWRWWAASGVSLSGVATAGLHQAHKDQCLIEPPVQTVLVFGVCEILSVSDTAAASITDFAVKVA